MDRADADAGEHYCQCLRAGGHVDGDAIALLDAQGAQSGAGPLHLVKQPGVGVDAPLAALVFEDEGRLAAPSAFHVIVEAVVAEVGLGADEPPKGGRRPLKHAVPLPEPRELLGRASPEPFRVLGRLTDEPTNGWIDHFHGLYLRLVSVHAAEVRRLWWSLRNAAALASCPSTSSGCQMHYGPCHEVVNSYRSRNSPLAGPVHHLRAL